MIKIHVVLGHFCSFPKSGLLNGRCKYFYFERQFIIKVMESVPFALKLEA